MPRPTTGKRLLIGAIVAVIVGAGALAFVWPLGEGDAPRRISIAAPGVRQPRWRITTEPAGVIHSVHRDDRRRIQRQARALTPRIRRLFNAIFLYPNQVARVVNRFFSEEAEVSLKRSKAGLPRRVSDIKIMRRTARIGVDVSGATRCCQGSGHRKGAPQRGTLRRPPGCRPVAGAQGETLEGNRIPDRPSTLASRHATGQGTDREATAGL